MRTLGMADDRVLIVEEAPVSEVAGIQIPETARERVTTGVVLAAGPLSVYKTDDKIWFSKYAGVEVTLDGEEYRCLRDTDVIAILNHPHGRTSLVRSAEAAKSQR